MGRLRFWLVAVLVACVVLPCFAAYFGVLGSPSLKPALAAPFLMVSDDKGHGSGVHIGGGGLMGRAA